MGVKSRVQFPHASALLSQSRVAILLGADRNERHMRKSDKPEPDRPQPTTSFSDVTKAIAQRNQEAQQAARIKRDAREKAQIAMRREWDRL